jgi:hypothetical protein
LTVDPSNWINIGNCLRRRAPTTGAKQQYYYTEIKCIESKMQFNSPLEITYLVLNLKKSYDIVIFNFIVNLKHTHKLLTDLMK